MSRLRARWRQRLAHRRLACAQAARRRCCAGLCTTSVATTRIPAQRRADLRTAQNNERALTAVRDLLDADVQAKALVVAERRTATTEAEVEQLRRLLGDALAANRALRSQLFNAMGYSREQLAAIESGAGEPRSAVTR